MMHIETIFPHHWVMCIQKMSLPPDLLCDLFTSRWRQACIKTASEYLVLDTFLWSQDLYFMIP